MSATLEAYGEAAGQDAIAHLRHLARPLAGARVVHVNSTMVGVYTLSMAGSYYITGQLGRLYAHLSPAVFWGTHVAVMAAALVFLAVAGAFIARGLARRPAEAVGEPDAAAATAVS